MAVEKHLRTLMVPDHGSSAFLFWSWKMRFDSYSCREVATFKLYVALKTGDKILVIKADLENLGMRTLQLYDSLACDDRKVFQKLVEKAKVVIL